MNITPTYATCRRAMLLFIAATLSLPLDRLSAEEAMWQSLEAVRTAAQEHVRESQADGSGRMRVVAAELDQRLHLAPCPQALRTETPWAAARGNRVTVRVSCSGEPGWRVHVPVDVVVIGHVVTTTRALPRGAVLGSDDLTLTEAELGTLGHGYFADVRNVVGQQLKRPLAPGSVVTPAQLAAPSVVRRGQNVTIIANTSGIAVKMQGTALSDGAVGQIIDIENDSSGRRVQGVIRSPRSVEILLR